MEDINIQNAYEFFKLITLDDEGRLIIQIGDGIDTQEKGLNQYYTYKKIKLTQEGYLKVEIKK